MAAGNNNAAINAGLIQSLGGIASGAINAYGNRGPQYKVEVGPLQGYTGGGG